MDKQSAPIPDLDNRVPFAFDKNLTQDEINSLGPLGLIGTSIADADFSVLPDQPTKYEMSLAEGVVDSNTKMITVHIVGHDWYFGKATAVQEHPLVQSGIFLGKSYLNASAQEAMVEVYALLDSLQGDNSWGGKVRVMFLCYG
ncbi:hypothetical protein MOF23_07925 [Bacillus inaquosorum]|uniref:hypothetical protein n=1 Tax=Bacillus inaquosorum TaxID=483913 RepID=UPI002280D288|nr:hypothetical protein [Bacillus inaquosorum]MCY9308898.1 hypothetical protein [Bacillus inaquosorum]